MYHVINLKDMKLNIYEISLLSNQTPETLKSVTVRISIKNICRQIVKFTDIVAHDVVWENKWQLEVQNIRNKKLGIYYKI